MADHNSHSVFRLVSTKYLLCDLAAQEFRGKTIQKLREDYRSDIVEVLTGQSCEERTRPHTIHETSQPLPSGIKEKVNMNEGLAVRTVCGKSLKATGLFSPSLSISNAINFHLNSFLRKYSFERWQTAVRALEFSPSRFLWNSPSCLFDVTSIHDFPLSQSF